MTTYRTSQFDWIPRGQQNATDIGSDLALLFRKMQSGDTLVVDNLYEISGGPYSVPDNVTIRGSFSGTLSDVGFYVLDGMPDSDAVHGVPYRQGETFRAGNNNFWFGLRITQKNEEFDPLRKLYIPNKKFLMCVGKKGFIAEQLYGDAKGFTFLTLMDSPAPQVNNCSFFNGKHGIYMIGACDDAMLQFNEVGGGYLAPRLNGMGQQIHGDGLKTVKAHRSGGVSIGPKNVTIAYWVARNTTRDMVDTTGGFYNGRIFGCKLYKSSIDLKNVFRPNDNLHEESIKNKNIRIFDNTFIESTIVFTSNWRRDGSITDEYVVQDVHIENNNVYSEEPTGIAFLHFKDCQKIYWNNTKIRGMKEIKISSRFNICKDLRGSNTDIEVGTAQGASQISGCDDISLHYKRAVHNGQSNQMYVLGTFGSLRVSGNFEISKENGMIFYNSAGKANSINFDVDAIDLTYGTAIFHEAWNCVTQETVYSGKYTGFKIVGYMNGENNNVKLGNNTQLSFIIENEIIKTGPNFSGTPDPLYPK